MPAIITNYDVLSESSTELITVQEAKDFMYVDFADQDNQVATFLLAARRHIEKRTSLSLKGKSLRVVIKVGMRGCESIPKNLPYGPVVLPITKLEYQSCIRSAKKDITSDITKHISITGDMFPRIEFFEDGVYTFQYSAGYTTANLPPDLKTAWLNYIAAMYENRGDVVGDKAKLAEMLITPHKRVGWLG